jgi:hypothetical protein
MSQTKGSDATKKSKGRPRAFETAEDFEKKFINHFLFREIGFETVGRFQH